jgi:uncharacterized protein YjbI with pentapeptide repeats
VIGIGLTYLVIEVVVQQNSKREAENQRKKTLILQLGSENNDFALEARRHLKSEKWLYDGSLQGINLINSNLQEADLSQADLRGAYLSYAKLKKATLFQVELQNAQMNGANLQSTRLMQAKLQRANLSNANLQEANLFEAKLEGANLSGADLTGAHLKGADLKGVIWQDEFLGTATLPDGKEWKSKSDINRFVDSEDPEFGTPRQINML